MSVLVTSNGAAALGRLQAVVGLIILACGIVSGTSDTKNTGQDAGGISQFLRFVPTKPSQGRLETSISRYELPGGKQVSLIAAVHIADGSYFEGLNTHLVGYDAVLYEMIKDSSTEPQDVGGGDHPISQLQLGLKSILNLTYQLEGIDYSKPNFVHADMDPSTFARLQRQKGEDMFTLLLQSVLSHRATATEKLAAPLDSLNLLLALTSRNRPQALKYLFAREMNEFESVMAGVERGVDGTGSVILQGRNEVVMRVLDEQLQKVDKKKVAIFFGAAHMPDLEGRLLKLDARLVSRKWLTAWDLELKPTPAQP